MLICDNGVIREMTAEEIEMVSNLPDPESNISKEEAYGILVGDENDQ